METISVGPSLKLSRLALGLWRLMEWQMSAAELQKFIEESIGMGLTTFDHADIYGLYQCEEAFGRVLKIKPSLREQMQLVTKCGIRLKSSRFPDQKINHYDTSFGHILKSVEASLQNLHTDHIDLLLIHRPDPLMSPEETAGAFYKLKQSGKVLHFGVSNFTPMQFDALNKHFGGQLVTNQVEISPYCLEHFHNGNMDLFMKYGIHPMGWSPLAGGQLMNPSDEKGKRIYRELEDIADELGGAGIDQVIFAWILYHPARIIPVIGSGKTERIRRAAASLKLSLTREQWYRIYIASQGYPLP